MTDLDRLLDSLKELYPKKIDLSLDRLYRLLAKLGNPQDKTPPVIHVAGTNGKGSTIAFLRAMLESAGYKCHVYTSPHLIRFNERIRLAGKIIDDETMIKTLEEVKQVNGGEPISFFEITTAAAFVAFARTPADVLLLEVGMGGLNDATNVVREPFMTVITTISYDHTEWLGRTLGAITLQKAGIMKPGVPCIIGHQREWAAAEVMPVFREQARTLNVPLITGWSVEGGETLTFRQNGKATVYPAPNLPGAHQFQNAGAAIAALKSQNHFIISDEHIAKGLQRADWPGRLERINQGTVAALLPPGWELWYDGAHNDSCGEVLGAHVRAWKEKDKRTIHAVTAMLKSKDPAVCLGPLLPYLDSLSTFSFPAGAYDMTGAPFTAEELATVLRTQFPGATPCPTLPDAVSNVVKTGKQGIILVTGTLYAYKELFVAA